MFERDEGMVRPRATGVSRMGGFQASTRRTFAPLLVMLAFLALIRPTPALSVGETDAGIAERPRLAFVIGNSDYGSINKLRNPVNDGKLVSATLKKLNFTVVEGYDLGLTDMYALFSDNSALIDNAEAIVVYYAGHGFQFGGTNYLVPVDAKFQNPAGIGDETVTLDGLIELLESPDRPLLLFLDACRNNPLKVDDGLDGLAQVTVGTNTYVAFATAPGAVTKDGRENNSPFARALAKNLEVPGLSILNLDISVREDTRALTINQQNPFSQQTLLTDFFFSERQTLNPNALLLAVNTIMTDGTDEQRTSFQFDMEELGLQGAVMRAAQREVVLQGLDLYSAPPAPAQVASASAGEAATLELSSRTTPAEPAPVPPGGTAAPVATLLFASRGDPDAAPGDGAIDEGALKRQLQTELRRLGCYNMAIDGDWGRGSRAALRKYYEAKGLGLDDLEPSAGALNRTLLESGRICRAPVEVRPVTKRRDTPTAGSATSERVARRQNTGESIPTKTRKPTRQVRQLQSVESFRRPVARGQSTPARRQRADRRNDVRRQMGAGFGIGGF